MNISLAGFACLFSMLTVCSIASCYTLVKAGAPNSARDSAIFCGFAAYMAALAVSCLIGVDTACTETAFGIIGMLMLPVVLFGLLLATISILQVSFWTGKALHDGVARAWRSFRN